ncbi:MAG: leucyl aminopeptidase [Gemmatimonadota bacterium]|nr:MAG: leucyl aminopeptidase [Gemmatimonadota bacterium]
MNHSLLEQGVRKLVQVNGRARPGERVVVVADEPMTDIADPLARQLIEAGAEVVTCTIASRERDGQEPPPPVAAAMREAQLIYTPVSVSITHTRAMRAALEAGARAVLMTAYTEEILTSPGLLETDFEVQAPVCRRLGKAFTKGDRVRLTSPRGTDLRFSIKGRRANVLTNIPDPGELAPVPDIEVNVVPVEGTAEGTLIADASVPYLGIGVLREPIVCDIRDGFIIRMKGGEQAEILSRDLESHADRNCFNVAELGVGLNPNARLTGLMLDDEGVLGTVHIGIGTSHTLGGNVVAPTHYDLLMWDPTIELDGNAIQRGKEILV